MLSFLTKNPRMAPLISVFLLLPLLIGATSAPSTSLIGVIYNPPADSHGQQPEQVVAQLQRLGISSVRLPAGDPAVVRAFSYSNISILLTVPNNLVPALAANRSYAAAWLYGHVVPFYPRARIFAISVGSDVLGADVDLSDSLLPAIRNVHGALHELGIRQIVVSTAFSFINALTAAFPPSAAEFQEPAGGLIIKPLLDFLRETNSSFLINLYPYEVYRVNPEIPIGFALFQEGVFSFRDDPLTGVRYRNLYDTMVDAVITAMAVAGHESIPLIVAETGWPCSGAQPAEVDANQVYAEMFLRGLVTHLNSRVGTPSRKEGALQVYVYELFDSHGNVPSSSSSSSSKRSWGVLYSNMTGKTLAAVALKQLPPAQVNLPILGWCVLVVACIVVLCICCIIIPIFVLGRGNKKQKRPFRKWFETIDAAPKVPKGRWW